MILQASNDTGNACYGVAKFAEICWDGRSWRFGKAKWKMKTIEHDENEIYKFLGVEQADGIKIKEVSHRAKKNVHHSRKI